MDFINNVEGGLDTAHVAANSDSVVMEASNVSNAVLQRLMEEVKNDQANDMFAYDRAHNRHNRS